MTVHVLTFEHADAGLIEVQVFSDPSTASTAFTKRVTQEEATGEKGFAAPDADRLWVGEYGSRIRLQPVEVI